MGIPTVTDRVIQQAMVEELAVLLEKVIPQPSVSVPALLPVAAISRVTTSCSSSINDSRCVLPIPRGPMKSK
jgi:hypothetical protein